MTVTSLLDLLAFSVLGAVTVVYGWVFRRRGINVIGTPAIPRIAFGLGKGSMFACWGFACAEAMGLRTSWWTLPAFIQWAGTACIVIGTAGSMIAYGAIGNSLRMGLPVEQTELRTGGIFAVSRNPFYTSFLLLTLGSVLHSPGPWSLLFGTTGAILHHWIILGEERYLAGQFGERWREYAGRVRRYF